MIYRFLKYFIKIESLFVNTLIRIAKIRFEIKTAIVHTRNWKEGSLNWVPIQILRVWYKKDKNKNKKG